MLGQLYTRRNMTRDMTVPQGLVYWVLLCCLWTSLVSSEPFAEKWEQFTEYVKSYDKSYQNDSVTMMHRFEVFQQSLIRHQKLNMIEQENKGSAVYGVNKFSDMTPDEFQMQYLSPPKVVQSNREFANTFSSCTGIQSTMDWRDRKVVTSIKNQEQCGSCWAFSVVEVLESAYAIHYNTTPVELSTQQLISCDFNRASLNGCKGGILQVAFQYVNGSKPVVPANLYPFVNGDGSYPPPSCMSPLPVKGVKLNNFYYSEKVDECTMAGWLLRNSPLSASADAKMWQDYISGIIQHHCTDTYIDHAVQLVGYNLNNDPVPHWIVRNTWGTDWGEDGYTRIMFGDSVCGINKEVVGLLSVESVNMQT